MYSRYRRLKSAPSANVSVFNVPNILKTRAIMFTAYKNPLSGFDAFLSTVMANKGHYLPGDAWN